MDPEIMRPVDEVEVYAPHMGHPGTPAYRAILLSWLAANGLDPARIPETAPISVIDGRFIRCTTGKAVDGAGPGGRPAFVADPSSLRPLIVAPAGFLAPGDPTCGHIAGDDVQADSTTCVVCVRHVDPETAAHPGMHRDAAGHGWHNEHPGEQAHRNGLPDVTGMRPGDVHQLVQARLDRLACIRWQPPPLVYVVVSPAGLFATARTVIRRHPPTAWVGLAGPRCVNADHGTGGPPPPWPCPDYRDLTSGIVTGWPL